MTTFTHIKSITRLSTILILLSISVNAFAKKNIVPEPFRGQDNKSTISISYDDYSEVLRYSVLDLGKSKRAKSTKTVASIGSRVKKKRESVYTALEGNRFLFRNFKTAENKAVITTIRKSLEKVPDEVAMSMLNAREQLAFWLNLYNISLIEQLNEIYPKLDIEDELYGSNGIMNRKTLMVSGVSLSLNDIHKKIILGKFSGNPLVIYGLFQGTIGGPNIRKTAYTGATVIKQLRKNAAEFINSNRGTYKSKKQTLRVSSFYQRNEHLFPNFKEDLRRHLSPYMDDNYSSFLDSAKKIKANIKVNKIADLNGGQRERSSSAATNTAALLDSAAAQGMDPNLVAGGEGSGGGFVNPSTGITSGTYHSQTVNYGRFSPE